MKPVNRNVSNGFFSRFKPLTFLALIIVYLAVLFDLTWMWGVIFIMWLSPDICSDNTHLVEPISRSENPVWYWLIIGTWLWMSVYLLLTNFG